MWTCKGRLSLEDTNFNAHESMWLGASSTYACGNGHQTMVKRRTPGTCQCSHEGCHLPTDRSLKTCENLSDQREFGPEYLSGLA